MREGERERGSEFPPSHKLPFLVGKGDDVEVALAVTLERAHKRDDLKVLGQRYLRTWYIPRP